MPGLGGGHPSCMSDRCASRALCGRARRRLRGPAGCTACVPQAAPSAVTSGTSVATSPTRPFRLREAVTGDGATVSPSAAELTGGVGWEAPAGGAAPGVGSTAPSAACWRICSRKAAGAAAPGAGSTATSAALRVSVTGDTSSAPSSVAEVARGGSRGTPTGAGAPGIGSAALSAACRRAFSRKAVMGDTIGGGAG